MIKLDDVDIKNKEARLAFKRTFKTFNIFPEHPCAFEWDQLHEARKNLMAEMDTLLGRCEDEKRDLNETEEIAYRFAEEYLTAIQRDFKRREDTGDKRASDPKEAARKFHCPDTPDTNAKRTFSISPIGKKTYRELFPNVSIDDAGFETAQDFYQTLTSGRSDPRLEGRTFVAKDGPSGGFAVPSQYAEQIFDQSLEAEIVRPRARPYAVIQGLQLSVPAWNHENHSTSLYGSFIGDWAAENSSADTQTGRLRLMTMTCHKLRLYTEVSREALTGGIGFDQQIGYSMTNSMGYFLDEAYINGNGVGKPLGYLNSGCCIKIPRAGANAITYTDVTNMYSRLAPAVAKNAVWLCSISAIPQLLTMKDDSSALIWQPVHASGVSGGVQMSIFGLPFIPTEKLPSLGVSGDLSLCAFSEYAIALKPEFVLEQSNAPGWSRDVTSYRGIVFTDGMPLWSTSIQPRDGSTNTLSPFVALSSATT